MSAEDLAKHMKDCMGLDAAVVMQSGSADPVVQQMLDAGWTYERTEIVDGKRIRVMRAPKAAE